MPARRERRARFVRRSLDTAARDGEACRLRCQGWTIREIADHLYGGSKGDAARGIDRALAETASLHGGRQLRELMIEEIREIRKRMWAILDDPPPAYAANGKIITREDGREVPDVAQMTAAASVIIRSDERLAKVVGLDAPRRSMTAILDIAELQARSAELRAELGITEAAEAPRPALPGAVEPA